MDATHFGCGQINLVGTPGPHKVLHGSLIGEIKFGARCSQELDIVALLQAPHQRRAHHALVSCNKDASFHCKAAYS
jgi:hypothetical protein